MVAPPNLTFTQVIIPKGNHNSPMMVSMIINDNAFDNDDNINDDHYNGDNDTDENVDHEQTFAGLQSTAYDGAPYTLAGCFPRNLFQG